MAGSLIYHSFNAWDENPVRTTIETRPINEIEFPKVTVCPPKNTYTNLNYDLEKLGFTKIDFETEGWKILKNYVQYSQSVDAELLWKGYHQVFGEKMLNDWYNDKIDIPEVEIPEVTTDLCSYKYLCSDLYSWSSTLYNTNGKITFPDSKNMNFDEDNFDIYSQVLITLGNPFYDYYADVDYGYYDIKISYDIVADGRSEGIRISRMAKDGGSVNYDLDAGKNYTEFNVTRMTYFPMTLQFIRKFREIDFRKWKNRRYTGFTLEWEYHPTEEQNKTINFPKCEDDCIIFKSFANLLHLKTVSPTNLTNAVEDVMSDWILDYVDEIGACWGDCTPRQILLEVVLKRLGIMDKPVITTKYSVSQENLEIAAKLMVRMMAKDSGEKWQTTLDQFHDSLVKYSVRSLLQKLVLEAEDDYGKQLVLDGIVETLNLSVADITKNIKGEKIYGGL